MGAILTQRTNWKNVELALNNLKKAGISSFKDIYGLGEEKLASLIKPSGFYKTKTRYLLNLIGFIFKHYKSLEKMRKAGLKDLRERLLELKGVGSETADSILLYALDKPIFVIDEYTRRLVKQLGISNNLSYIFLQNLFEKSIKKDFRLYQDFHALIVIHSQAINSGTNSIAT